MVLFNSLSRNIAKGMQIGQDSKPLVLRLDEDFDKVFHFDVPCHLHKIEVSLFSFLHRSRWMVLYTFCARLFICSAFYLCIECILM